MFPRALSPLSALLLLLSSPALVACSSSDEGLGASSEALRAATQLDASPGGQVLGRSADGRRIVYGVACDSESPTLKLRDGRTGRSATMATGVSCMPGSVSFSANGELVAFGNGQGAITVYDAIHKTSKVVSRDGLSGIGVLFSPSSTWLVVASMGEGGVALDAWNADLASAHEIASGAFFSPFPGGPNDNVKFSPDGQKLLYVGGLTGPMPVGALSVFDHATSTSSVIAQGVPAPSVLVDGPWKRVAFVRNVTVDPNAPPSPFVAGDLVVHDVASNTTKVIETGVAATPIAFAACDALVYVIDQAMGAPATLKAAAGTQVKTLDTAVFRGFGPGASIAVSADKSAIAYVSNVDPMRFDGDLEVTSLSRCSENALEQTTVATHVVPMTATWAGDETLVYLHDATSNMPGSASGTLASWSKASGATDRASNVTQLGLVVEPSGTVRYLADYDAQNAAGTLTLWTPSSGNIRVLGEHAAVMSIQATPEADGYGFLSVTADPTGQNPPATALMTARTKGRAKATTIANDVTSFAMGQNGQIVYATNAGVYRVIR